jgi:hypothetical protein
MWRSVILPIVVVTLMPNWRVVSAQDVALSWYPAQPGNSWIYLHESRDAGNRGIAHPMIERWKTEETIISTRSVPAGTLVVQRTKVFGHVMLNGWLPVNDVTKRVRSESYFLLHEDCLYGLRDINREGPEGILDALDDNHQIRPPYLDALLHGNIAPDFCFPMTVGSSWGQVPDTSPAEEDVWHVKAVNGDPFGATGARTSHLFAHQGSGTVADVWFEQGVGVLQEVVEHHGTYWEDRRQLLRTIIGGTVHRYRLKPARTVPRGETECKAGWRHFVRADGTLLGNVADCVGYSRKLNQ